MEEGTATFGNLANSAGVGGGHGFVERTIDGYLAVGCFCIVVGQQLSVCALGILQRIEFSIIVSV
jgi:hypothetical protein